MSHPEPEEVKYFPHLALWRAGHQTSPFRSALAGGPCGWGKTAEIAILGYECDVHQEERGEYTPFHVWLGDKEVPYKEAFGEPD